MVEIKVKEGALGIHHYMRTAEDELIARAIDVLTRRIQSGEMFTNPCLVKDYLRLRLGREEQEVFGVIWLNAQNRVIKDEVLFVGSVRSCSVYPKEVVKSAIAHNASATVIYHNHPSNEIAKPSGYDDALTRTIKHALAVVDVTVADHIIVNASGTYSYAEHGLI